MRVEARQRPDLAVGATRNGAASFVGQLDAGELLAGTPTVEEVGSADLAITNVAVSTAALTINGRSVAAGQAVQWAMSGAVDGTAYTLKVTAATDATPPQTLVLWVTARGVDEGAG